jgi:hypothetical protein
MGEAMREALGELAQARPARSAAAAALRIVSAPGRPSARST